MNNTKIVMCLSDDKTEEVGKAISQEAAVALIKIDWKSRACRDKPLWLNKKNLYNWEEFFTSGDFNWVIWDIKEK